MLLLLLLLWENKSWHRGWKRQRWTMAAIPALRFTKDQKIMTEICFLAAKEFYQNGFIVCIQSKRRKKLKSWKGKKHNNYNCNYNYPLPWTCQVNQTPFHGQAALRKSLRHQNWAMRASLDWAGILFKLMCPHSRNSEVLPSIYFWFRDTFSAQWGENQGHCRAKFPAQQVVSHPSVQGMDSGLFIPRKRRFCVFSDCCNLCPHHTESKPAHEQQNHLLASPSWAFQWHQPAAAQHPWAPRLWVKHSPAAAALGRAQLAQG